MDISDLRSVYIASESLQNDVRNLRTAVSKAPPAPEESKVWEFAGHQGRKVLVDRRKPDKPPEGNVTYTASSWKIGARSTEIHPTTGQHGYDTGNLYRTVHWKDEQFGLNGYFTDALATAGMWRHDGLNTSKTRSKAVADPAQVKRERLDGEASAAAASRPIARSPLMILTCHNSSAVPLVFLQWGTPKEALTYGM